MRRTDYRLLAAASLLFLAVPAGAASRPRYGGTLRVETQAAPRTLDPADPASDERLSGAVFEELTRLDARGRPQPALAVSWRSEQGGKRWYFRLRRDVKFHDGTPLTPETAASALSASATREGIMMQLEHAEPQFPAAIAHVARAVVLRSADGTLSGTGPFRIAQFDPGRRAVLRANEDHWEGRPFLDEISFALGRTGRNQMLALEVGKADLIELPPGEVRRAAQAHLKVWSSAPVVLFAAAFEPGRAEDARLREAVALSIDRAAIHTVLLQKQGEPAGGLLPQWISGHAFLFPISRNLARARELAAMIPGAAQSLLIGYDPADPLCRIIAERVAVNARDGNIRMQTAGPGTRPDVRVVRFPLLRRVPPEPLNLPDLWAPAAPEARYAAERALLDDFRLIPLVHLPDIYGSKPSLKMWRTPGLLKTGEWRFDDLWVSLAERP